MKLVRCTIRNYRVHQECRVEFDPQRTLIGGSNECGKSTLVEAIHRALFLKAKGNTEYHRAMQPHRGGQPEVELQFALGAQRYHLQKCFGTNGTISLVPEGGQGLNGDEAENALAHLLTGADPARGKQMLEQWSHLWVWQGLSGSDPTLEASRHSTALFQYLQEKGGAAAVQSGLDAELAARFREAADTLFRQNGQPKTGTNLDAAIKNAELTAQRLEKARQRLEAADQHLREYQAAEKTIQENSRSLETLRRQKRDIDDRVRQVHLARKQEEVQQRQWQEVAAKRADLISQQERILDLETRLAKHREALEPLTAQESRLQQTAEEARRKAVKIAREHDQATQAVSQARQHRDLMQAVVNRFEKHAALSNLTEQARQAEKLQKEAAELQESLARLPEITESRLKTLRSLENEAATAQATLDAMATAIEVVASNEPVQLEDQSIQPGETKIITDATELRLGNFARIRIRPGGGTTLEDARRRQANSARQFSESLVQHGLHTIDEAAELLRRRQHQETQLTALRHRLKQERGDTLSSRLEEAKAAATRADTDLQRRVELFADLPPDLESASQAARKADDALTKATQQEAKAKTLKETESHTAESAAERLETHRRILAEERASASDWQARHQLLEEASGNNEARLKQLKLLTQSECDAKKALEATRQNLDKLGADQVETDSERLTRALIQLEAALHEAHTRRAVAEANLRSNGIDDPHADYAAESAADTAAREHLAVEQRKADAIRLLADLFSREQRALADQFTQPLAEAIQGYLTCLFGPEARANVTVNEDAFSGLELVRPGQEGAAIAFEQLSGGAKEQVAAAMRLAVAEVLAAGFGGSLPVIFDDAFAYSDPERVQTLQRMLDRAAERGLQLIILTCNPADYAALGARQTMLSPPAP